MKKYRLLKQVVLLLVLIGIASTSAYADRKFDRDDRRDNDRAQRHDPRSKDVKPPKNYLLDRRYQHDRYYPPRGYTFKELPRRRYEIHYRNRPYYFSGGIWYGLSGGAFVVTAPPFGIVVPFLPPFYTTIWAGGIPYYYANDVYYVWQPERNGYMVTNPPPAIDEQATEPLAEQLFIYPKLGQSAQKQADDKYECHRWSVSQTGYDPSQPPGNMALDVLVQKRDSYQQAMKTCLEGRGYSVN